MFSFVENFVIHIRKNSVLVISIYWKTYNTRVYFEPKAVVWIQPKSISSSNLVPQFLKNWKRLKVWRVQFFWNEYYSNNSFFFSIYEFAMSHTSLKTYDICEVNEYSYIPWFKIPNVYDNIELQPKSEKKVDFVVQILHKALKSMGHLKIYHFLTSLQLLKLCCNNYIINISLKT